MTVPVESPPEGSFEVRRAVVEDQPGIAELYLGLSPRSMHTRFFSSMTPELLERAAGFGPDTVSVVATRDGRLVGEARYGPSEDTFELAVTVAEGERGRGLGTLLLDWLRLEARREGYSSLRALVSTENRAMLRVLEKVGIAVVRPSDGSEVVVDVGTDGFRPGWGLPDDRPRVLVETRGFTPSPVAEELRRAGFDVRQCPGPRSGRGPGCPLVIRGRCRLVEQADAVVHLLPSDEEQCAAVSRAHEAAISGQVVARSADECHEKVLGLSRS